MSMFRKPKKIQRRVFCADDDEDGDGEPEPPPPPLISQRRDKKENKSVKAPKLLSFADEEEECEEFKVKKSTQSKRLAKRRDKQRTTTVLDHDAFHKDVEFPEDNNANHTEAEEKPRAKKKVSLEGLILSGRAALAAGGGDVSDDGEEEAGAGAGEEVGEQAAHAFRAASVRAALRRAPGAIPDAALIHAARKTRQQARELGEFVPLPGEGGAAARRPAADDDDSGDDEPARLAVRGLLLPADKPERTAAVSDDDAASEPDDRALPPPPHADGAPADLNPFAVSVPRATAAPHLRPLHPPPASAADLLRAWTDRLAEVRAAQAQTAARRRRAGERLEAARAAAARGGRRRARLDRAYRRAQAARGYVTDLVECLDEKMPALDALERRALAAARRRADFLMERRRADLADQAADVLAGGRAPPAEDKVRRTAEREGRRRARRLRREAAGGAPHRDGDSSDDSLPPPERLHYTAERAAVAAAAPQLFADALPPWRSVRGVARRLAAWRRRHPRLYADAHVPAALPKLLAPYVRTELVLWNPLADEDNEDYEKMEWFKTLMMYGVRRQRAADDSDSDSGSSSSGSGDSGAGADADALQDDVDIMLLPTIIAKVLLPKVTEYVECAWDPVCVRASVRLRGVVARAGGVPGAARALAALGAAAARRLAAAHAQDVFLPALAPAAAPDAPPALFWRRCLGAAVRLLRAALALTAPPALLRADRIVMRLIETLCVAAGASGGAVAARAAAALAQAAPRAGALRGPLLARVAALARRARTQLAADNPLHLKALEQTRAVIAAADAAAAEAGTGAGAGA